MTPPRTEPTASPSIEVPAPTVWPFFAGLGISLLFAGLVTHVFVAIVGLVFTLSAAVGWWREVLPQESVEHVPVRPPGQRARGIEPAPGAVAHLTLGEAGHRVRLPATVHPYPAGIKGGLVGGVAMAALACAYGLLAYGSIWYPVNLLAATAVPSLAEAPTEQLIAFDTTGLAVAIIAHVLISLFVGLVYAALLPTLPSHPMIWGGLIGPLVWTGLLHASMGVINPALANRIDWSWFIASQIAFGLTAGYVIARTERVETLQTWPLAVRAGIEATGVNDDEDTKP
jgi:hypothetical protein